MAKDMDAINSCGADSLQPRQRRRAPKACTQSGAPNAVHALQRSVSASPQFAGSDGWPTPTADRSQAALLGAPKWGSWRVARMAQKVLPSGQPTRKTSQQTRSAAVKKTISPVALAASSAAFITALTLPSVALADLSFNVGALSDYRYRGISQSRLKPAAQGGVDWSAGPFYVGLWASTIKWIDDVNPSSSNQVEIDIYGGYKGEITKALAYDVGLLAYQYPGHKLATSPNTTEIYGALTYGPATLKYSHSVTNLFGFADSENSSYVDLTANFEVGPVTLTPHLGYQKVAKNGDFSYTDYSLIVSKEVVKGLTLSGGVVGADTKSIAGTKAYASPANGKDLGKAGAVVGVKVVF
jgi:uncharacterized protein (TIGR02001 family)